MIYAGLTVEICAIEKLVHTGAVLPADLQLVSLTLPDDAALYEPVAAGELPGWEATPPGPASVEYGTDFLRSGRALGLIVPSAIVPEARNLVVNPLHPRFADVRLVVERPFVFDRRLRADPGPDRPPAKGWEIPRHQRKWMRPHHGASSLQAARGRHDRHSSL